MGVLLFVREGQGVLLETEEIKHLLTQRELSMYIIRLESFRNRLTQSFTLFTTWLGELFKEPFFFSSRAFHEAREDGHGKG
ncbi:hypothetical protein [Dictyobacter halimunensis]